MSQKMYATRKDLVDAVRSKNPQFRNMPEDEVYEQFIDKFPEYQSRVEENIREAQDLQIEEQRSDEADPDRKTAFTAMSELFSRDFYKYVPYVRDAELLETGSMLSKSRRLQSGTATAEDLNDIKGWVAEENRPTSWGYKTLNLVFHIPAYAVEFATVVGAFKNVGKVAAKGAAKAGTKKIIKDAVESTAGQAIRSTAKKAAGSKAGKFVKESVEQTARGNFQNMLAEAATKAGKRELKLSLKGTLKGTAQGMREAAVRNVLRSPQAVNSAIEKMIPQMKLSEGLDGDLAIEIIDEGDNLFPALAKAYGDQQIEFFTESIGDSLRLAHNLWGKEVLSKAAQTSMGKAASSVAGKAANKYDEIVQAPIKAAISKFFLANRPTEDLRKILRKGGWNGVIEEMYEERVGDIMRGATGLQENFFPTADQLASEAVAFALFGAGSSAAYAATHSKVLGGAGIQEYLERIGELSPEGEEAIRTKREKNAIIKKIAAAYREEIDNPSPLLRLMRSAATKINDLTGLDLDPQQRGGINDLMTRLTGSTLTAHIATAVESGQDVEKAATTYLEDAIPKMGTYVVANKGTQAKRREAVKEGKMTRMELPGKRSFYLLDADVWDEQAAREEGFVVGDIDTINKIEEKGLLEGEAIKTNDYKAKAGSNGYRNAVTAHARLFNMRSREDAKSSYDLIQKLLNSPSTSDRGIRFVIRPGVVLHDTNANFQKQTGYAMEGNPEDKQFVFVGASNQGGIVSLTPTSSFSDIFEDYIEATVKDEIAMYPETSGVEYKALVNALSKENKENTDLMKFSDIELMVKMFLSKNGVSGQFRTNLFEEANISEDTLEILNDFVGEVVGKDVMELVSTESESLIQIKESAENEEGDQATVKETDEPKAKEEPIADADNIDFQLGLKFYADGKSAQDALLESNKIAAEKSEQAAMDFLRGYRSGQESDKSHSLQEFVAKKPEEAKAFVSGEKTFGDLIEDYKEFAGQEQFLPETMFDLQSFGSSYTFNEVERLLVAQEMADAVEQPGLDDELQETIEASEGAGIVKLSFDQKANMHKLVQEMNSIVGQGTAQRLLISIIRNNPELLETLGDAASFEKYMSEKPLFRAERWLQEAARNTDIAPEYLRDTLRFFSNVYILPVKKYWRQESGLVTNLNLNRFDQYDHWANEIDRNLQLQMKNFDEWKAQAENRPLSKMSPSEWLSNNIGLESGTYRLVGERFAGRYRAKIVAIMKKELPPVKMRDEILKYMMNKTTLDNGRVVNSVFHQLATETVGESALSPMFYNINGDMTSAARQTSHLISFLKSYAGRIGIPVDQAMVIIDGYEDDTLGTKAAADSPVTANRELILNEMFDDITVIGSIPYYWQSIGRMGDKGHIYAVLAQQYSIDELKGLVDRYRKAYGKKDSAIAEEFLLHPDDFASLVQEGNVFESNYAYNKAVIDTTLHGDYAAYGSLEGLVKRSSQIPTGGESFTGEWNVLTVRDIDNRFDGMALFTDRFGKSYADFMGPNSMRGAEKATAIKAHVSNVDGSRELIKVNWINISELDGIPFYEDLAVWVDLYEQNHAEPIDLIVFDSGAKLTPRPFMDFIEKGDTGRFRFSAQPDADLGEFVTKLDGTKFITSQWLNHSRYMTLRNTPKQMNTDLVNMDSSRKISVKYADLQEELLSALDDAFPSLSGERSAALAELREATLGAGIPVTDETGNLNPEFTDELLEMMQAEMEAMQWTSAINRQHYVDMFRALILNGENETDPRYINLVEGMKARFIEKRIARMLPGAVMQKVSEADSGLPDFRMFDEKGNPTSKVTAAAHTALPWIITNVQNGRTAMWGLQSKEAALEEIRSNSKKYADLFFIDPDGNPTDKVREYELFEDSGNTYGGGWIIPGEILFETRIPAENVHSHIPHRLYRSTSVNAESNLSITPYAVQERKGEDFDGDKGFLYGLVKYSSSRVDQIRNQILLLQANDYTKPKFWNEIRASVDVQDVFTKLAEKYDAKARQNKRRGKVYANTVQGELHAHAVNATSYDALSAVAAGGRLWDYAQALGFELTDKINGLTLYGSGSNAIRLSFSRAGIKKLTQKQRILRKLYYQTALVNMTVDDPSHPTMHKLNINEITAPIVQALIVLNDTAKSKKQIQDYIGRIITFLKSPAMVDYVNAQREMTRVDFVRPITDKGHPVSNSKFIADYLGGNHGKEAVDRIMQLHQLMRSAREYSRMFNLMYSAPTDYADFYNRKKIYTQFINNMDPLIDTSASSTGDEIHPHFAALENAITYLDSHAFADNILKTDTGRDLLANAPEYLEATEQGVRKINRIANRAVMVSAMQFANYNNPGRILGALVERMEDSQYANRFTDLLIAIGSRTETEDNRRIEIAEKYRYSDIPKDVLDGAREDFDSLPQNLKQAFALYNYLTYGVSGSTFTGSYSTLFGSEFSKWISEQAAFTLNQFKEGKAEKLADQILALTWNNSVMNWEGNFFKGKMLESMSVLELERPEQSVPMSSIDAQSHSLQEFHRAVTARSPMLFSGAKGLHKAFLKHLDNLEADQYNARINRERWEIKTGARKSFVRSEKTSAEDRRRGLDMLAAAIAMIEGTKQVIQGFETIETNFIDAFGIRREQIKQRFPEYFYNTKASEEDVQEVEQFRRTVKNYGLAVQAEMTIAQAKDHLLYIRMVRWMKANDRKTFPIHKAIIDHRSASDIAAEYDGKKKEWMLSSSELVDQIRDEFERVRVRMNTDMIGSRTNWIGKRPNYVSHYYFREDPQDEESFKLKELERPENLSRAEKRSYKTYIEAAEVGNLMPASTNIAEIYERWMNETSKVKFQETAWGILLMGSSPSGIPSMIPVVNAEVYDQKKRVLFPVEMLDAFARRLAFATNEEYKQSDTPIGYLNSHTPNESDYELMNTGISSIPQVWVRKDQTRNIVKMMTDKRNDGTLWRLWERMNAWTKFMAIGFPYMSYFHKAALLESAIAIKGVKNSPVYTPVAHYKEFKEFRKHLLEEPDLAEWWIRRGLQAKNTHPDYAQGIVNKDLEYARDKLGENYKGLSHLVDRFLDVKSTWDNHLWQDFHTPLKIWLAEGEMQERRAHAIDNGYEFNEDMVGREIAAKVDDALGGQQFQRNLWGTPKVQQTLHNLFFAYDWTISALGIAGMKNIPGMKNVFGFESPITNDIMYRKYWPAFAAIILFGIPNAMQAAIYALTRPLGGDDDDRPFTFLNEHDRASWVDITPLLRLTSPIPVVGYDGDPTGERRVYLRWGKQAYEVFEGWLQNPLNTLGHKASMTVKTAFEQVTGRSMGGWELDFKDAGLLGALEVHGSFWKSRAGNITQKFVPFVVQDIINGKPTAWFAKAKAGKSEFYAQKQLTELYLGYVSSGKWHTVRDHHANVIALGSAIIDAAYENGYNGQRAHERALAEVRKQLYPQLLKELKQEKFDKVEMTAQKIIAMNGTALEVRDYIDKKNGLSKTRKTRGRASSVSW